MQNNQGFDYAYGCNIYYERILGLPSRKTESGFLKIQRPWAWVLVMAIFIWIPQTAALLFLRDDLNSFIKCLATNIAMVLSILKLAALQFQRRDVALILVTMANDWTRVGTKYDLQVMNGIARITRLISSISLSINVVGVLALIISRICISMHELDNYVDPRLSSGFIHTAYFPFETSKLIIFIPLWLGQFFATILAAMSYSGPACFFSMCVLHLCGQLTIICHSLKCLVNDTTIQDRAEYWRNISAIIERHEELNKFSFVVRDTFSFVLLAEILVCSVSYCFQGYVVIMILNDRSGAAQIFELVFSVLYAIFSLLHLFTSCYVGDRLLFESTSLCDNFYETEWYNLASEEAKAFLFVCHRSKVPLEVKGGKFFTFNLQLFNSILKNSMGYLSMLLAMKERLMD